jgi:hypothetical protein
MRKAGTLEDLDETVDSDTALRAVPDLSGVPVDDATGIRIGALFGALAESDTGLLRYFDLALDTLDRHVLVPIGHARMYEPAPHAPKVRLRAALLEDLEGIPPHPPDVAHITDPFERSLLEAYGRTFHGDRYYAHPAYDHGGVYAGEHPVVGPHELATTLLQPLSQLPGWEVDAAEPDIRGWTVRLDDGTAHVADLIVDPPAEIVRYLALSLAGHAAARLLPIGYCRIDTSTRAVVAAGLLVEDIVALPAWDGGAVTRALEDATNGVLRSRFIGKRRYMLADYRPA